jgi:hypothetical protein
MVTKLPKYADGGSKLDLDKTVAFAVWRYTHNQMQESGITAEQLGEFCKTNSGFTLTHTRHGYEIKSPL